MLGRAQVARQRVGLLARFPGWGLWWAGRRLRAARHGRTSWAAHLWSVPATTVPACDGGGLASSYATMKHQRHGCLPLQTFARAVAEQQSLSLYSRCLHPLERDLYADHGESRGAGSRLSWIGNAA